MILAAGLGTRLGELGLKYPKCMVPVGGHPLLYYIIQKMKAAGVTSLVLNLHHLGEQIRKYLADNNNFGLPIEFSHEEEQALETGGGIKQARSLLEDNEFFIVHNGDIYCDDDLGELVACHQERKAVATVMACPTDDTKVLLFDERNRLAGWKNRATGERIDVANLAGSPSSLESLNERKVKEKGYGGVQVLSPAIFQILEEQEEKFSIVKSWLKAASRGMTVVGHPTTPKTWIDIGTEQKVAALDELLISRCPPR